VPNYEYKCTQCDKVFELWQPVGEAAPPCPDCASQVKKVFHPPRVIFKGSGFYVTDLRAENDAKSKKPEKTEAATAATDTKTESKSEPAKSESKGESKSETSSPAAPSAPAAPTPSTASTADKK